MTAPNNTALLNYTDSIAKAILDFNAIVVASSMTTGATNINTGVSGTGASATLGRVLAYDDPASELLLLPATNVSVNNIAAYLTGLQSMNSFYLQLFTALDKFDSYINANVQAGGVNAWLTTNTIQVNAWFAAAFNYYQSLAASMSLRTSATAPTAIAAANYFPYAIVDPMFSFTSTAATTLTPTSGSASSTQGGGTPLVYIYKTSAGTGAGGASLNITYINGAGVSATLNGFSLGTLTGSAANVSSGSAVSLGINAQSIVSITGTGMTNTEAYSIGARLVRSAAY